MVAAKEEAATEKRDARQKQWRVVMSETAQRDARQMKKRKMKTMAVRGMTQEAAAAAKRDARQTKEGQKKMTRMAAKRDARQKETMTRTTVTERAAAAAKRDEWRKWTQRDTRTRELRELSREFAARSRSYDTRHSGSRLAGPETERDIRVRNEQEIE